MANAPTKPTTPVNKESSSASGIFASLTIPICLIVTTLIFIFVLGDQATSKAAILTRDLQTFLELFIAVV